MMILKYGLQFFFFELTDNDGQNFVAGIVREITLKLKTPGCKTRGVLAIRGGYDFEYFDSVTFFVSLLIQLINVKQLSL
jgi:hypothetical protein